MQRWETIFQATKEQYQKDEEAQKNIEKYKLHIIIGNENKHKRKWMRKQGEERSIIDYIVTIHECMETIKRWTIRCINQN